MATVVKDDDALEAVIAALGTEVAPGDIDRELARFYNGDADENAPGIARASLLNLAVYTETPSTAAEVSLLAGELTRETACRVLLILADLGGPRALRTWIQGHCRLSDQGEKTVCTEQISFWLGGADAGLVRNTLFAHLDSDLPLVFWWRGELSEIFDERLHSRIDRFIFDSSTWRQAAAQLLRVQRAIDESGGALVVHDLAYTRSHPIRSAIARVFDDTQARRGLDHLSGFEIVHRPGHRMTALWLHSWILGRLKREKIVISCRESQTPAVDSNAEAIESVNINLGSAGTICIEESAEFWRVAQNLTGFPPRERLFPRRARGEADLVSEILIRAGRNRAMTEALPLLRQLAAR